MNRLALPATLFLVAGAAAQDIDSPPLGSPGLPLEDSVAVPTIPATEPASAAAPAIVEPALPAPAQVDAATLQPAELMPMDTAPAIQAVELPPADAEETTAPDDEGPLPVPVARPTDGFFQAPGLLFPDLENLRKGFRIGASASMTYDSNVNPGFGGSQDEGDLIFTIGPNISYSSGLGGDLRIAANLGVNYSAYLDNSDLGGFGYSTGLSAAYDGGPLTLSGGFTSGRSLGTNQNYGAYSETTRHGVNFSASYAVGPKTDVKGSVSYGWADPGDATASNGAVFGESENLDMDLTAMWRATPLVSVGPGIAWSQNSGQLQGDRESIGPVIRGTYQLARKVSMNGNLGYEFVDYGGAGGRSDTSLTAGLGLAYRASVLWGMNLSVFRGTTADGAGFGSYRETTSIRGEYTRRIRDARLALGASYEINDSVQTSVLVPGGGTVGDTLSLRASVAMPVFADRASLMVFGNWRDQSGGSISGGDGYQVGVSLSAGF